MTVAAIVIAQARRRLEDRFLEATAFSPESAIPFTAAGRVEARLFDRLRRAGVIRSAQPGAYYVDQVELAHEKGRRRTAVAVVLTVLTTAAAVALALA